MKLTFATASFLVLCTAASAQTNTVPTEGHHQMDPACKAAIEKLCPGVQPGNGRIRECLKQHNTSFKQLCPQDARKSKHSASSSSSTAPVTTAPTTAPLATPPAGQ